MPNYLFDNFDELEESIRNNAPRVIYKYRGDWNNDYHREIVTKQTIWFAGPKELNDEYDIRTPIRFDAREIEHPLFLEKLKLNFIEEVRKAFPSKIPIYQVYPAISGYGLIKTVIA